GESSPSLAIRRRPSEGWIADGWEEGMTEEAPSAVAGRPAIEEKPPSIEEGVEGDSKGFADLVLSGGGKESRKSGRWGDEAEASGVVRVGNTPIQSPQGVTDPPKGGNIGASVPRMASENVEMGEAKWQMVVGSKAGHRVMAKPLGTLVSHQRFGVLSVDTREALEDADFQRVSRELNTCPIVKCDDRGLECPGLE
ncbi:hypothetical protein Dimus_034116, partial [Dionaea muscipula]